MKVYVLYYIYNNTIEDMYEILGVYKTLKDAQQVMSVDSTEFEQQIKEYKIKGFNEESPKIEDEKYISITGFDAYIEWVIEEFDLQ